MADQYHHHEVVDRCYLAAQFVEQYLLDHPGLEDCEDVRLHLEQAHDALAAAYQAAGRRFL